MTQKMFLRMTEKVTLFNKLSQQLNSFRLSAESNLQLRWFSPHAAQWMVFKAQVNPKPIRYKTNPDRNLDTRVFPRFPAL